jgi:hypothetical protein
LEREISAAALQMYFQYNFSVQRSLAAGANNLALWLEWKLCLGLNKIVFFGFFWKERRNGKKIVSASEAELFYDVDHNLRQRQTMFVACLFETLKRLLLFV